MVSTPPLLSHLTPQSWQDTGHCLPEVLLYCEWDVLVRFSSFPLKRTPQRLQLAELVCVGMPYLQSSVRVCWLALICFPLVLFVCFSVELIAAFGFHISEYIVVNNFVKFRRIFTLVRICYSNTFLKII